MDQFVLGKRRGRVNCEIIEADMKGNPPDQDDFDESSQSLLDVIVEQNDKVRILMSVYILMCLKSLPCIHTCSILKTASCSLRLVNILV